MKWNEGNGKQDQVCDDSFVHVCVPFVGFSIACWGRAIKCFHHGDTKSTEILWWKSKRPLTATLYEGRRAQRARRFFEVAKEKAIKSWRLGDFALKNTFESKSSSNLS